MKCKKCDVDISAEIRKNVKTALYAFKKHIGREPSSEEIRQIVDNVIKDMFKKTEQK